MNYVLLIEDDQWLADSYQVMLRAQGINVRQVSTGHEAMQLIEEKKPAVVVADVLLGDHTSITLFHELQSYEDTRVIPIILCTTLAQTKFSDAQLKSYGIVVVLDKATLTPEQLLMTVSPYIEEPKGRTV
jgi:DNA-binding response OmpR family regulator